MNTCPIIKISISKERRKEVLFNHYKNITVALWKQTGLQMTRRALMGHNMPAAAIVLNTQLSKYPNNYSPSKLCSKHAFRIALSIIV